MVLLHGFFADGTGWRLPLAHLERQGVRRRWVAIDLPGHGRSRACGPNDGEGAWQWLWHCLDAVVAQLAQPPLVIGYSMGARVAASWALAHHVDGARPRLAGLMLESGHPGLEPAEAKGRRDADAVLAAHMATLTTDRAAAVWEAQPIFAGQRERVLASNPQGWRMQQSQRLSQDPVALARALRLWGTGTMPDLRACPSRPELPALVWTGGMDVKFAALAPAWSAVLPSARLVAVPGAGHHVSLERPQAWAEAVARWLE